MPRSNVLHPVSFEVLARSESPVSTASPMEEARYEPSETAGGRETEGERENAS